MKDSSAVISPCGLYRYELRRLWDTSRPLVGFVMLNPSRADAEVNDRTICRCIGFARAWGYGGLVVRNLYAMRATDPSELTRHDDPVGPDNDTHLARCGAGEEITVVAWGSRGGERGRAVLQGLHASGVRVFLLARTADGQPRHPLYLRRDARPAAISPLAPTSDDR